MPVKKEHTIQLQGRTFVTWTGLLDAAHEAGLKSIRTTIVQIPHPDNLNTAIVHATAEFEGGRVFEGVGDANPQNVNRMVAAHLLRMAETRSKARCLRDAINVGEAAIEELGGADGPEERTAKPEHDGVLPFGQDEVTPPAAYPHATPGKAASANQLAVITNLAKSLGQAPPDKGMTSAEAAEMITQLSRQYNERHQKVRS